MILFYLILIFSDYCYPKDKLLWEMKNDNSTVYLTGSIHLARDDMYPLDSAIINSLNNSKYLVLEVNPDSLMAKSFLMMNKMMIPAGKNLKSSIDSNLYAKLKSRFDKIQIPESIYSQMKPWAAVLTLSQLEIQSLGMGEATGIDQYFFNIAKKENIQVLEIESFETQLSVFEKLDEYSEIFFEYSLNSDDETSLILEKMITAWKFADLNALDELINKDANENPEFAKINKILLDDRNHKMVEKIEEYMKNGGTYFVCIGAGHLSGKNGLLNLLKEKNYNLIQK